MLSNLSTGTRLYMKSPEGPRLELITLTHGPAGPLFTVTPNTCRYPERKEINLPHLLGFYNKHVLPEGAPRYDGNPFKILFLLDGDQAGKSLEAVETERLAPKPEPEPEPKPKPALETVPCACCDPDAEYDDEWSYDEEDEEEEDGRTDPDAMNHYMEAVAASAMKQEEAKTRPSVRVEDDESCTYPCRSEPLRLFKTPLPVYVQLPGAEAWNGIHLVDGKFYTDDSTKGVNEWHLLYRYRTRFNASAVSSTVGLQAVYVASGVGANESLARLLLDRTDAELAVVGSTPTPPPPSTLEPPVPGAIAAALARITTKEQALLQELAELEKVQAAMARIAALESRVAEARQALKGLM
jgi:hypothetical protein